MFLPPADFSDLDDDVLPGSHRRLLTIQLRISAGLSALATASMGFDGPAIANLGNIFPAGLTEAGVNALLNINDWVAPAVLGAYSMLSPCQS